MYITIAITTPGVRAHQNKDYISGAPEVHVHYLVVSESRPPQN